MAKKDDYESVLKNLKGFCQLGTNQGPTGNIQTGHFNLDFILNYGEDPTQVDLTTLVDPNTNKPYDPKRMLGLPLGKIVEIFGEEGGGKSSLAYRVAGFAQKMGLKVAWIDTEHSFMQSLAKINGCDASNLFYSNLYDDEDPDKIFYAEDVMDSIVALCKAGIKVVVVDSVANLTPKARFDANAEKHFMGLLPRLLSENLGRIGHYAEKYGVLLIFINQLREKLNQTWGDPETSPGGHALKHNASVVLKVSKRNSKDSRIMRLNDRGKESLIGRYSMVHIVKNRMAKPYYDAIDIPVYFEAYFPDIEEVLFNVGRQIKLITVRNDVYNWTTIVDEKKKEHKVETKKGFIDYIKDNNLTVDLANDIKNKAKENGFLLPPEVMQYEADADGISTEVQGNRQIEDSSSGEGKPKKTRGKKGSGLSEE